MNTVKGNTVKGSKAKINKAKINKANKVKEIQENNSVVEGIKYIFSGYLITFLMIVIYAALLTFTEMTDKYIMFVILLTTIMSTTFIGYKFAKNAENRGMFWGILGGLLYGLLFVLLGVVVEEQYVVSSRNIFVIAFSLIAGGIGGIIGINSKK